MQMGFTNQRAYQDFYQTHTHSWREDFSAQFKSENKTQQSSSKNGGEELSMSRADGHITPKDYGLLFLKNRIHL